MRKIEEFQETKKLMEEYKGLDDKIDEIENQKTLSANRTRLSIERMQDEMNLSFEDIEMNIDRKSVIEQYNSRIEKAKEDQKDRETELDKQKEDTKNEKKFFRTDSHLRTITMEIEAMKKEVQREEVDLKKKDIELQEFYQEEQHENPLKWQEIYKEQDEIRSNIKEINNAIEEYTSFLNELKSIELTPEEYKRMFELEKQKPESTEPESTEPEPTESESTEPESTEPEPTEPEPTEPEPTEPESTKPEPTEPESTEPESTEPESTEPESTEPKTTKPVSLKDIGLKISIGQNGAIISYKDEDYEIKMSDLSKENDDLIENVDGTFGILLGEEVKLTEEQKDNIDGFLLTTLYETGVLGILPQDQYTNIVKEYFEIIKNDEKDSTKSDLKDIIEYDRTNLDYLKPSNIFKRIIHKSAYDNIREYADFAEDMGFATIKKDEPGVIRKFLSNIKNKIPLLSSRKTKALDKGKKEKNIDDKKALHEAMDKYYKGEIKDEEYTLESDKTKKDKANEFLSRIRVNTSIVKKAEEEAQKQENEKIANAFARHVTIGESTDEIPEKDNEEHEEDDGR